MIENNIKAAFNEIHAEQSLKQETKQFIYDKIYKNDKAENKKHCKNSYNNKRIIKSVVAVACCVIVLLGASGYYTYNTPAAVISFDINPSIELEVNIFDKIINVISYNSEGQSIIDDINLKNKNYVVAINEILKNEKILSFLQSGNNVEILVAGKDENKSDKIRACLLSETNIADENIHCSNWDSMTIAHSEGVSCGKYHLYLQLQNENPSITIEDIKNLSMYEIKEMLQNTTINDSSKNMSCDSNCGNQGHKHQHGYGSNTQH